MPRSTRSIVEAARVHLAAGARAWHYNFEGATARWIDDRDRHDLNGRLAEAISERIGRTIEFNT